MVRAYNKAVDQYNENLRKDFMDLLKEDSRFKDQSGTSFDTDTEVNSWLTVGKVTVGSIFKDHPGDIQKDSAGTDAGKDYSSDVSGKDVYYWDRNSEDQWTASPAGSKAESNFANHLNGSVDDLTTALGDSRNLSYLNKDGNSGKKLDLSSVTTKWVLKVSNGANDYAQDTVVNGTSQLCWHLDGYLKVTKLAKLAELAAVPTNDYKKADPIQKETVSPIDPVKEAAVPTEDYEISDERLTKGDAGEAEFSAQLEDLGEITLTLEVPGAITPVTPADRPTPPTPPTPPTGGGGGGGTTGGGGGGDGETTITEEPTPLVELPEDAVEIPEEEVPLAELPEEESDEVEIPDKEVPLAEVPKTGDISAAWYLTVLVSLAGLLVLAVAERRLRRAK